MPRTVRAASIATFAAGNQASPVGAVAFNFGGNLVCPETVVSVSPVVVHGGDVS